MSPPKPSAPASADQTFHAAKACVLTDDGSRVLLLLLLYPALSPRPPTGRGALHPRTLLAILSSLLLLLFPPPPPYGTPAMHRRLPAAFFACQQEILTRQRPSLFTLHRHCILIFEYAVSLYSKYSVYSICVLDLSAQVLYSTKTLHNDFLEFWDRYAVLVLDLGRNSEKSGPSYICYRRTINGTFPNWCLKVGRGRQVHTAAAE